VSRLCLNLRRVIPLLLLLVGLAGAGCRKVENPRHDFSPVKPTGFLFNYEIPQEIRESDLPKIRKIDPITGFNGSVLRVLSWPDALPKAALDAFYQRSQATVKVQTFSSNFDAYTQLTMVAPFLDSGKFDLVLITGYMAERLAAEGKLCPLVPEKLPNLRLIDKNFRKPVFDRDGTYCVPYLWTTIGIGFNTAVLDRIPRKWTDLFDFDSNVSPILENRVGLLPSARINFAIALLQLGYSPNSESHKELVAAETFLSDRISKFQVKDDLALMDGLASGRILMAQCYSSDVQRANVNNVHFCIPEDGTGVQVDCFVIPQQASPQQKGLAEAFINHMLEPAMAAQAVTSSYRATTVTEARTLLPSDLKKTLYMNRFGRESNHVLQTREAISLYMQSAWEKMQVPVEAVE
jgi:spermidine/putrescine transport system substrate-binding protein